jgi:hypothetical protein
MWEGRGVSAERAKGFFYLTLSHASLQGHYIENYYLLFEHHQSLDEWDQMLPYEREVYLNILIAKQEEKLKNAQKDTEYLTPPKQGPNG